jgi:ABC-2 type transport system permease protein
MIGGKTFQATSDAGFAAWANRISFTNRFEDLAKGVIDLRDVTYFVSFAAAFLGLNVAVLEARKAK